jgi:peptidoglycan/LPS O-acetylase OafA/YrhL
VRYRPEIDGLRAVSVLSVFLFHLGDKVGFGKYFGVAPGGYVGVDIFFAISGYLITSLIRSERQRGEFSLVSFYVRRVRRIASALLVMMLATIAAGYLVLAPGDYELLARSGLYALAGASNFFFFSNSGYFSPLADTMPLLHTWSLGVEEQFYIVWPGLLIVLTSLSVKTKIPMLVFISAIVATSLTVFLLAGEKDAFYMPYARAWELGLGAAIAFLPEITGERFARLKKILPWLGLALIITAVSGFNFAVDQIGRRTVASTIGAFFIIVAIEPKTSLHRILSSAPFVFVGKISYSLYLWHFPVIVFWRWYSGEATISPVYFGPFIVSVTALSWLSWRYIEEPCRRATLTWQPVFSAFIVAALAVGCACWAVVATQGGLARIPESMMPLRSRAAMWEWPCSSGQSVEGLNLCTGGAPWDSAAAHAVIWGDSNAQHFMPLLDVAGRQQNVSISLINYNCAPIVAIGYVEIGSATYAKECDAGQKAALAALQSKEFSLVILSAAWSTLARAVDRLGTANGASTLKAAFTRLIPQVSTAGRVVTIMSEIPKWFKDPVPCIFTLKTDLLRSHSSREMCQDQISRFDRSYFQRTEKDTDDMIRSLNGQNGAVVWPMVDNLCSGQSCTTTVDDEFIYYDSAHLRRNLKEQTKRDLTAMLHFAELLELAKNKRD